MKLQKSGNRVKAARKVSLKDAPKLAPSLIVIAIMAIAAVSQSQGYNRCSQSNRTNPLLRSVDDSAGRFPSDSVSLSSSSDCLAGKPYCFDAPIHLNSPINTPWFEGKPALSADGLELYFVSDRPGALGGPGDQDIYLSRRQSINDDWGPAERVPPPISSPFFDITPTISRDGLALYFGSNRPGPFSPPLPDLWVSHRASVDDPWGEPENLGPGVNTPLFEASISVSDDELVAYFAGVTPEFVFKIFMSKRDSRDQPFGPRVLVDPPINFDGHAYGPELTPNGKTMFFSAGFDNPFAPYAINHLYVSERKNENEPWGNPIYLDTLNCPSCFGGLPTIRADGKEICWMGDRGDSCGDKDIYCARRR
jgi:WD40-like Beta Propeller Repeat